MIWFLEGLSSQRDMILGARDALPRDVKIFASHRQDRPEITRTADISLKEPEDVRERIDWVLEAAGEHGIKVIQIGRGGRPFEAARGRFESKGLQLVTGGLSPETFDLVEDKGRFTIEAERAGLPCVPAIAVADADALADAFATLAAHGEVCVKPAVGIYGQGFWKLKAGIEPFRCFAHPETREVDFTTYLHAYSALAERPLLLVMPYLSGSECSVDIVCEAGRAVAYVGRRKQGLYQSFERESGAVELALKAAAHFQCDGVVNVQTRDDADGNARLLEINPRYSGGIGYTREAGVNLPGIFAARRLGLPEPEAIWRPDTRIKTITVAIPVAG